MPGLPLLDLDGAPYERGVTHGRALADLIGDNIETYLRRFESGGLERDAVLVEGENWAARLAAFDADYGEEVRGIADGAGLPLGPVAMLNARYELIYSLFSREALAGGAPVDGCTAFGALPERTLSGGTLIGQNWDWLKNLRGHLAVLRLRAAGKPAFLCITQAGIAGGMIGLNEAGIGLCLNGLTTDEDGRNTELKPLHVRVRQILQSPTLHDAIKVILESDRVCSANFLLGHADGEVIDIEAAPTKTGTVYPDDGLLTHANHFVATPGVTSTMERISPSTLYRAPRLARLLRRHDTAIDMEIVQNALTDHFSHPRSICAHPDPSLPEAEQSMTVTSVVLALSEQTLYATDGPPCENPYQAYHLAA